MTLTSFEVETDSGLHLISPAFVMIEDRETAWAGARDLVTPRGDFGWMMANFCQGGPGDKSSANTNGHVFSSDELKTTHKLIPRTPFNMLHRKHHVIGTYVGSEFLDPNGDVMADGAKMPFPYVEALAAVWKYHFPDEWNAIQQAHDSGSCWMSMEAVADSLTCLTDACSCGNADYAYRGVHDASYCDSLNKPRSLKRLNNPHFVGGAAVIPPALPGWKRADVTQMAWLIEKHPDEAERVYEQVAASATHMDPAQWQFMMACVLAGIFDDERPMERPTLASFDLERLLHGLTAVTDDDGMGEGCPTQIEPGLANYRPAESPDVACATCQYFDAEENACELVAGVIDPGAVCDLWDPEVDDVVDVALDVVADHGDGIIVAIVPPPDVVAQLAELGTQPADQVHLTLVYLGKDTTGDGTIDETGASKDRLAGALAAFAHGVPPFTARLSGLGTFTGVDGGEVTYASVDAVGLSELRTRLVAALVQAGVETVSVHGFTPHVTLAAHDPGKGPTEMPPTEPWPVDHLELWWAGEKSTVPLAGGEVPFAAIAEADARVIGDLLDAATPTVHELEQVVSQWDKAPKGKRAVLKVYLMRRAGALDAPADLKERIKNLVAAQAEPNITVTVTTKNGIDPAQIASAIAEAVGDARRPKVGEMETLGKAGKAFKNDSGEWSYPTPDLAHLKAAVQAWGRSIPKDRPGLKRYLSRRADALNAPADVKERIKNLTP